jgi:TPR repeat protein
MKSERFMKKILIILVVWSGCWLAQFANAQTPPPKHHHKQAGGTNAASPSAANTAAADAAQQLQEYQKTFVPTDPWRIMNDKTNFARGLDWVQFEGRVTQATAEGLVLQGWYGEPLAYLFPNATNMTTTTFYLSGYPRHTAVGQLLSRNDRLMAYKSGQKNEMANLEYGVVYVPQLTEEQKEHAAQAKTTTESKVLAWHEELAKNGDAYGEYKMGMRYLNGDGVDKDPAQARDLLNKSAAQGNQDAKDALAKLSDK